MNMKQLIEFIKNFKHEDYKDELEDLNKEITSKYHIKQVYLEHVLQKHLTSLVQDTEKYCYLECGVFRGRTLLVSALGNPDLLCVGVDHWELPSEDICRDNIQKSGLINIKLITSTYQNFFVKPDLDNKKPIIYLYDAGHSYADQKAGLEKALPYLADEAIILVDDTDGVDAAPYKATMKFVDEHDNVEVLRVWTRKDGFSVGTIALEVTK